MNVTVLGSGHVGLVSAACLAEIGNDVVSFDVDCAKIDALSANGVPFHERDLATLVERNGARGKLYFTSNFAFAVRHWKTFKSPNLEALKRALKQPMIFDGRNLYGHEIRAQGFEYMAVGR